MEARGCAFLVFVFCFFVKLVAGGGWKGLSPESLSSLKAGEGVVTLGCNHSPDALHHSTASCGLCPRGFIRKGMLSRQREEVPENLSFKENVLSGQRFSAGEPQGLLKPATPDCLVSGTDFISHKK